MCTLQGSATTMAQDLRSREFGMVCPRRFRHSVADKLSQNFRLSRIRFPRNYKGSIFCLDVEHVYGQYILSASAPNSIRVHNLQLPHSDVLKNLKNVPKINMNTPMRLTHESVTCVQWYPNSINVITSSGKDGNLKVWDVGRRCVSVEIKPCPSRLVRITQHHQSLVSRIPVVAVSTPEPGIPVLDLRYGSSTMRLKNLRGPVNCCRWSTTDEYQLASAADSTVHIWDVRIPSKPLLQLDMTNAREPSSSCVAHSGMVNSLEFSPDGLRLATFGTDCAVRLWCAKSGRLQDVNCGYVENTSRVCVRTAFNRGSRLFVPARHEIRAFHSLTGEPVAKLKGHMADVYCVQYNPLYESAHSAGRDRNVLTWSYPKIKRICAAAVDADSDEDA